MPVIDRDKKTGKAKTTNLKNHVMRISDEEKKIILAYRRKIGDVNHIYKK